MLEKTYNEKEKTYSSFNRCENEKFLKDNKNLKGFIKNRLLGYENFKIYKSNLII